MAVTIPDGHSISAKHSKQLHPRRNTVHRLELEPASFRHTIPPAVTSVIVKQQKDGWEEEFVLEKEAYERLNELQGVLIPQLYGQGSFNGLPALILSDVEGLTLYDYVRNTPNVQEDTLNVLETLLRDALKELYEHGAEYWDQKLDNFLFCDNGDLGSAKVKVVDLEEIHFPNQIGSWETNVNLGGVGFLMSDLRDIRDRNREPPVHFWKRTPGDESPLRTTCRGGLTQSMNRGNTQELEFIIHSADTKSDPSKQ
ncbi:uncharacterized protein N7459_007959 [Penicillium hispanicum]|uniref:uncharacterized protein n=1 Tax=Penicillium hispanicum TaxID=1080232 RepID=UPI00253FDAF5|nr:uncharacterized protein N7459_007959 [Penicillium hispanicum]KAJ5573532.1 hypothetical protein N7459_007959 [Penicillium hispanicum]